MIQSLSTRLQRYILPFSIASGEKVMRLRFGQVSYDVGPKIIFPFGLIEQIVHLRRYSASAGQYLTIKLRNGKKMVISGPTDLYEDPLEFESVRLDECIGLRSGEALVVYREDTAQVTRHVILGPFVYIPQSANEFFHEFKWHGEVGVATPEGNKVVTEPMHFKSPNVLQFTKLQVMPAQLYLDVANVRTSDDALLTVRLMIFYELKNIEQMLDATNDPIADFINATQSDVIAFATKCTFEEFKSRSTLLNDLSSYSMLQETRTRIGFHVSRVVNRGYVSSSRLQQMHDQAIESRTSLVLARETEEQQQDLARFQLEKNRERAETEMDLERRKAEHARDLETKQQEMVLMQKQAMLATEEKHYQALHRLDIDLTQVMVAQAKKVDHLVQIEGGGMLMNKLAKL